VESVEHLQILVPLVQVEQRVLAELELVVPQEPVELAGYLVKLEVMVIQEQVEPLERVVYQEKQGETEIQVRVELRERVVYQERLGGMETQVYRVPQVVMGILELVVRVG
jgi:hypothetical protein